MVISLDYLTALADVRFAMSLVASLILKPGL
jgi:hypothetical protein